MTNEPLDFIGDLHGNAPALRDLLRRLGYSERGGAYRHSERTVVFLGDYIDRGPAIRETLTIVRSMVDAGTAVALCGNHELDLLLHETPDGRGGWLRPHEGRFSLMHARTLAELSSAAELRDWLRWFQTLPLWLDVSGVRAVHAYWDSQLLRHLPDPYCLTDEFLPIIGSRRGELAHAVHELLKGPEIPMPANAAGPFVRDKVRVRWWHTGPSRTYRAMCIDSKMTLPEDEVPAEILPSLRQPDPEDRRPLFFGHYWLPPQRPAPLSDRLACLDFSAAGGGPMCAYRWDGEPKLFTEKFVYDPSLITNTPATRPAALLVPAAR